MSEELKAALARIACLEGEIAKRDARIMGLESQYQRDVWGLNNEGDPIGGEPAGGYANDNARLRAELAAIKAQEPVAWPEGGSDAVEGAALGAFDSLGQPEHDLESWCAGYAEAVYAHAAPVSEAKAQGVVMPERWNVPRPMWKDARQPYGNPLNHADIEAAEKFNLALDEVARLNAAPVQQVSVPDERIIPTSAELIQWAWEEEPEETRFQEGYSAAKRWVKMQIEAGIAAPEAPAADAGIVDMYRHLQKVTPYRFKKIQDASITDGGDVMYFHKDRFDAALLADMAAHCAAKGVV